jgi:hypothetical protein
MVLACQSPSSIHLLPLEVLTQIFEHARKQAVCSEVTDACVALGFTLGAVCRHFRRTVRVMKAFWGMIAVSSRVGDQRAFGRFAACLGATPSNIPLDILYQIEGGNDQLYTPLDSGSRFFVAMAARASCL